jgi:hypothetical protein
MYYVVSYYSISVSLLLPIARCNTNTLKTKCVATVRYTIVDSSMHDLLATAQLLRISYESFQTTRAFVTSTLIGRHPGQMQVRWALGKTPVSRRPHVSYGYNLETVKIPSSLPRWMLFTGISFEVGRTKQRQPGT